MAEFAFPLFDEWQDRLRKILDKLAWPQKEHPIALSRTTYNDVRMMIADPLELPSHRDYYREERAALVCANFIGAPRVLAAGGVAFLLAMAGSQHTLTRISGLQIADSLWQLRGEMVLDESATAALGLLASTVENMKIDLKASEHGLKDIAAAENLAKNCSEVVRAWLKQRGNMGNQSLSHWLSQTA